MTNYRFRNLLVMIVFLTVIDALLTTLGITLGFQEANPVMQYLIKHIGILASVAIMTALSVGIVSFVAVKFSDERYHVYLAGVVGWKLCIVLTWIGVLLKL